MRKFLYRQIKTGLLAHTLGFMRIDRTLMSLLTLIFPEGYIRIVNYHDVPNMSVPRFEEHVLPRSGKSFQKSKTIEPDVGGCEIQEQPLELVDCLSDPTPCSTSSAFHD